MSTQQIPLADLLQQPSLPATAEGLTAPPSSPLAEIDDEMLARIYFQHTQAAKQPQSLSPDQQFKFAALGLGAMAMAGAIFTAWLYRPVHSMAQAEVMRDMGQAMIMQQQQVEAAIATANPPSYKCNSLLGSCHFPEAEPAITAAQLNALIQAAQQQQPAPQATITSY